MMQTMSKVTHGVMLPDRLDRKIHDGFHGATIHRLDCHRASWSAITIGSLRQGG